MPITHITFLIACLAIAGVPPLSGFFSKDEILAAAWSSGHYGVFTIAMVVAGMTAFYMFRLYFMAFWSEPQDHEKYHHAHESPISMTFALSCLAVPSIFLGFLPFSHWVHRGELEHHGINWAIAIPATLVGLAGIFLALLLYVKPNEVPKRVAFAFGPLYRWVSNKFYVDELYLFMTHNVIFRYCSAPLNWFDRRCVDGFMDLVASSSLLAGSLLRRTVTGRLQTYLLWSVAGSLLFFLTIWQLLEYLDWISILFGAGLIVAMFLWQWILQLLSKSEPLKRIERD